VIAIFNSLPVKEGAADEIVDRFAESRGHVQGFPGFVSMEVLKADAERTRCSSLRAGAIGNPSRRGFTAMRSPERTGAVQRVNY
jgi:hypothetical protein